MRMRIVLSLARSTRAARRTSRPRKRRSRDSSATTRPGAGARVQRMAEEEVTSPAATPSAKAWVSPAAGPSAARTSKASAARRIAAGHYGKTGVTIRLATLSG